MQKEIINAAFDLFGNKIKAVHIKDFTFDGDKKTFAIAGTGELMTDLIFDRISKLEHVPEMILDETPIANYEESLSSLSKILG